MANRRFIDFPIASTVGDNDIILIWQSGMNKQTTKATLLNGLPENLEDLLDVNITGLTNGQILRYDSVTGKWENTDQGNLDLDDLNDVTIVSPTNGQVLVYNSSTSKWENSSAGFVPYTGAISTVNLGAQTIQAGSFVKGGGTSSQFLKADGSVDSTAYGTGSVTSVGLTMPSAFNVANSPVTTSGTLAVTGAGTVGQYIRGDGSLADFPSSSGGGSSVSYYLNGSISQGTIGGVAYKELNKVPILGTGTDFSISADGYIAQFLTDAGDPGLLEIPGGNWNFETYFSASSSGGSPSFYVELYKYDGSTFTLIASSSSSPELIAFGTNLNPYFSTLAVPTTALALTDRLAIRYYVTHSGRTITLHTENNHLCQVITTFTTGLTSLNGLTAQVQNFAVGTSGNDFNIASASATHTFNLPTASGTNRGALSSADWSTFNAKQNALTLTTTGTSGAATLVGSTLNIPQYQSVLTNPVTGTGTTNYLPKFTGASTIGNSNVIDNGTTVSVLNSAYTDVFRVGSSSNSLYFYPDGGSVNIMTGAGFSGSGITFAGGSNYLDFNTNSLFRMRLSTAGNLLIGTTTDNGARLQVSGTATFSSNVTAGGNFLMPAGSGLAWSGDASRIITPEDNVSGALIQTPGIIRLNAGGSERMRITSGGEILVSGTYNPYPATNRGNITLNGSASNIITFTNNSAVRGYIFHTGTNLEILNATTSGVLQFYTESTERGRFTSSGNLLVGTTTSGGAKLEVVGDTYLRTQVFTDTIRPYTGNQLQLLNGGSNFLYINGSVGVGTSSPLQKLHITQAADTAYPTLGTGKGALFIAGDTNLYGLYVGINTSDGNTYFQAMRNNSATAYNIIMQAAGGNVLIGTTTDNGARLQVEHNGNSPLLISTSSTTLFTTYRSNSTVVGYIGNGDGIVTSGGATNFGIRAENDLIFTSGGNNRRMTITSGGNVGIGTSSPSDILNLAGGASGSYGLVIDNSKVGGGVKAHFQYDADNQIASVAGITTNGLVFKTLTSGNVTEKMRITSGGNVLIGTTTDGGNGILQVNKSTSNAVARFTNDRNTSGDFAIVTDLGSNCNNTSSYHYIAATGGADKFYIYGNGTYATVSDRRLKKNIESVTEQFLEKVLALDIVTYNWNDQKDGSDLELGMIAQQVETAFPSIVKTNRPDLNGQTYKSIQASALPYILIKAIQELKQEIDTLKN